MPKREAILSLICLGWGGSHAGAWRHPDAPRNPAMDFERLKTMVQTAERGKFQAFFVADHLGPVLEKDPEIAGMTSNSVGLEPFTLATGLALSTSKIGLVVTASTTYTEPYNVARMFASLDHMSGGRAAWNVVASTGEAAMNFNNLKVDHEERYKRAWEFYDVVTSLWDSWEDDAFALDKETGVYFDASKRHVPNYRGDFYQVEGPLQVSRPPQGHPVIAQAGSSPSGIDLAATIGELLFTLDEGVEASRDLYVQIKERVAEKGRDPEHAKILPALIPVLGRTQAEADEKLAEMDELADPRIGIERLKPLIDFDLTPYPLDGPVPVDDVPATEHYSRSGQAFYLDLARREKMTVRQLALVAMQFNTVAMSTNAMVEHIEERIEKEACDGFNISFGDASGSLELFVDEVVPELQRRGLFWSDYRGKTLRENLGLPRPVNRFLASPSGTVGA